MTFLNRVILAGALALGVQHLAAAPSANDWIQQQVRAKQGVYTAGESARPTQAPESVNWIDQHLRAKTGTFSPLEEARIREVQNSSAFRQEPDNAPVLTWVEQHRQIKQGH
jgi:hypothetical protein